MRDLIDELRNILDPNDAKAHALLDDIDADFDALLHQQMMAREQDAKARLQETLGAINMPSVAAAVAATGMPPMPSINMGSMPSMSWKTQTKPSATVSPFLIVHFHGGGFIAQSLILPLVKETQNNHHAQVVSFIQDPGQAVKVGLF